MASESVELTALPPSSVTNDNENNAATTDTPAHQPQNEKKDHMAVNVDGAAGGTGASTAATNSPYLLAGTPADGSSSALEGFQEEEFGNKVEAVKMRKIKFQELFRYASSTDYILMGVGILCAVVAGAAFPLTTVLFGQLINVFAAPPYPYDAESHDQAFNDAYHQRWQADLISQVNTYTVYFLYLAIGTFVTTYIYMCTFVAAGENMSHRIREQYLKSVLRQDIGWHDSQGAGEVATRITSDMLLIQDAISEKVPIAASQVFTFMAAFVIAFYRSWRMTLVLLSVIPLIVASIAVMNILSSRLQARILNLYSAAGTIAEEAISSVRTVVAFNAQDKLGGRYAKELGGARDWGVKKSAVTGLGLGLLFMWIYLAYSLAFFYGGQLLDRNQIDAGTIVNVFFAVLIGAFSMGQIAPELQAFAFGIGAGSKIFMTLDRKPEIDTENTGGVKMDEETVKGRIELKDVEFTYPARPDVKILKGISLSIEPGSTVALVGQSGSGKSTIIQVNPLLADVIRLLTSSGAQLIERFYDVTAGVVTFDNVNVKDFNLLWLRQHIGLVSQEPTLFEGTVADNVAQGLIGSPLDTSDPVARLELIKDACRKANAHDFIELLPQGYGTQVGERGLLLSGGQKQRIAIARAIIKNPRVLLLDEATSALDTTSERVVQAALDNASKGRTTIVIAHRLSTIRNANLIVVMARGEIVEQGTHDELVEANGMYKKLVEAQHLNQIENEAKVKAAIEAGEVVEEGDAVEPIAADADAKSEKKSLRKASNPSLRPSSLRRSTKGDAELGEKPSSRLSLWYVVKEVYKLNLPEWKFTLLGLVSATIAGLVIPFFAIAFSHIIEAFSEIDVEDRRNKINFWAAMFVVLAAVTALTNVLQNASFGLANEYLTERVRQKLFHSILHQDISYFDDEDHSTGVLTSGLSIDAQKIQGAAGVTLGTALQLCATLFGGLIVAFYYGWALALVGMCIIPVLVLAGAFRAMVLSFYAEKAKKSYERSAQVACESVAAIRTVQSLTREKKVHDGYLDLLEGPLKDGYRNAFINTILYAISQCANFLGNALVFWFGGQLIAYHGYSIQNFFVVFIAVIFGSVSAGRIFAFVPDLTKAKSAGETVLTIIESQPSIDVRKKVGDKVDPAVIEGHIQFNSVRFVYPTRPNVKVLRGLNLTVKPGQFVALVGPSGCGKSTTIGLVERFYDPIEGSLTLDGKDIRTLNLKDYRDAVGLVSQEPNLFDISIEENIAFGCDVNPSFEEIVQAATDANIHSFIMTLPEQYKTKVGLKGSQLSGGQKQRIAIARALVRKPKVLLLDEATSALDAESEKVVQEALDKASKGRTTIAIAHRLSSIQNADVIYVLKDGVVAESGTHQELYNQRGLYYELVIQQDLDKKKKKKDE
ncbi:GTPase-activating protein [Irineochytrium annulatum]|nr:GTPase-activating protein [Irineochytrium annulatum]